MWDYIIEAAIDYFLATQTPAQAAVDVGTISQKIDLAVTTTIQTIANIIQASLTQAKLNASVDAARALAQTVRSLDPDNGTAVFSCIQDANKVLSVMQDADIAESAIADFTAIANIRVTLDILNAHFVSQALAIAIDDAFTGYNYVKPILDNFNSRFQNTADAAKLPLVELDKALRLWRFFTSPNLPVYQDKAASGFYYQRVCDHSKVDFLRFSKGIFLSLPRLPLRATPTRLDTQEGRQIMMRIITCGSHRIVIS